jgi:3-dehydroquinate synthase
MENILFTRNAAKELSRLLEKYALQERFALTDPNTFRECWPLLAASGIAGERVFVMEEGETGKSIEQVVRIWEFLTENGARRNAVLVNIGGGVVTDTGGFAASCFKRGIRCINVPTTLLAQVDASAGGKTGINFRGLKNEIGAFSFPEKVVIDPVFLETLPFRHLLSGYAEMLKHALLSGREELDALLKIDLRKATPRQLAPLIRESVRIKAVVVENDPEERGLRRALNFGHTVGHALESAAATAGKECRHGDAVACGMLAELFLSVRKWGFDPLLLADVTRKVTENYPPCKPAATPELLYALMLHDKKNEQEGVNFTLLRAPGEFVIDNYCSREEILPALEYITRF